MGGVLLVVAGSTGSSTSDDFLAASALFGVPDRGRWELVRVSYSLSEPLLPPGGGRHDGDGRQVVGWEILPLIEHAALVHVCHPLTPSGEAAILAGKILGKKLVVSDLLPASSSQTIAFGILDLVDAVLCTSAAEIAEFSTHRGSRTVEGHNASVVVQNVYDELLREEVTDQ